MGFLDRLLSRGADRGHDRETAMGGEAWRGSAEDRQALERYRYLLRTAPPDRLEQAHEEAFAQLSPEQRRLALQELSRAAPDEPAAGDDPRSLARLATRAELRRPGTVERAFGGVGGGMGGLGVPLLGSFATAFAGTIAANALLSDLADGELFDSVDPADAAADVGDAGADFGGDLGGGDFGGEF